MARYRKIDPRIWNDAKFRALSDHGKLVFFLLLTHPNMTALGAMRATTSGLAEEMAWAADAFREAFQEVLSKGMVEHDPKACLVAIRNFLRYNSPESPNVVKAWVASLDLLPECELKNRVVTRAKDFTKGLSEGFSKALPEAFAKAMPYQEQEQEQEQKQEQEESNCVALGAASGQAPIREPFDSMASIEDHSEPVDPRHAPIRQLIQQLHLQKFRVKCQWDGSEGKALDRLLSSNPSWTEEQLTRMVHARFDSEAITGNRPRSWLPRLDDYAGGPLDRFNKLKGPHSDGNRDRSEQRQASLLANRDAAREGIMARRSVDHAG